MAAVKVLLVDDQPLVRSGLRALLERDVDVVGEAGDGAEAHLLTRERMPDVVLMDVRMPGVDGLEATRRITADPSLPDVRIMVLTTFDLDEYVYAALKAGAAGFMLKHADPVQILHAIQVVAAGDALLAPEVTRRLISTFVRQEQPTQDTRMAGVLTERELAVVRLVAQGLSNDEIARQWYVSNATVRTHVSRAMTKLHARDRAQLVVVALRAGLADLNT